MGSQGPNDRSPGNGRALETSPGSRSGRETKTRERQPRKDLTMRDSVKGSDIAPVMTLSWSESG